MEAQYFAQIDDNNIVTNVHVVTAEFMAANPDRYTGTWIKTSYNTIGGVHTLGGTPLNKNYAGIGYTWDGTGFAAPQPYASWSLNTESYLWEPPVAAPTDGKRYNWDEATTSWIEVISN